MITVGGSEVDHRNGLARLSEASCWHLVGGKIGAVLELLGCPRLEDCIEVHENVVKVPPTGHEDGPLDRDIQQPVSTLSKNVHTVRVLTFSIQLENKTSRQNAAWWKGNTENRKRRTKGKVEKPKRDWQGKPLGKGGDEEKEEQNGQFPGKTSKG